jgi:hypothetical protein
MSSGPRSGVHFLQANANADLADENYLDNPRLVLSDRPLSMEDLPNSEIAGERAASVFNVINQNNSVVLGSSANQPAAMADEVDSYQGEDDSNEGGEEGGHAQSE